MKLLGLVLSLLVVSVLVVLQLRSINWTTDDEIDQSANPDARFFARCRELVPPKAPRPEDYCRCLWQRGVRKMTLIVTDPGARAAAAECERSQPGRLPDGADD